MGTKSIPMSSFAVERSPLVVSFVSKGHWNTWYLQWTRGVSSLAGKDSLSSDHLLRVGLSVDFPMSANRLSWRAWKDCVFLGGEMNLSEPPLPLASLVLGNARARLPEAVGGGILNCPPLCSSSCQVPNHSLFLFTFS